jgi:type II secretory pathway pseudopilin PulG
MSPREHDDLEMLAGRRLSTAEAENFRIGRLISESIQRAKSKGITMSNIRIAPREHPRRRAGEAGMALIIEMLIVCAVMLILAAVAIPNLVTIRASQNQTAARYQIQQVARAQAALALCNAAVPPLPCAGVAALVPTPGTINQQGYRFTFTAGPSWTYLAVPQQANVSGIQSYFADNTGVVRCGINGSAPAC